MIHRSQKSCWYRAQPEQNTRARTCERRECLGISTATDNAAFLSSHTCTDKVKAKRPAGPDKPDWTRWDEVRARKRYERDRSLPLPFVIAVYPILRRDRHSVAMLIFLIATFATRVHAREISRIQTSFADFCRWMSCVARAERLKSCRSSWNVESWRRRSRRRWVPAFTWRVSASARNVADGMEQEKPESRMSHRAFHNNCLDKLYYFYWKRIFLLKQIVW